MTKTFSFICVFFASSTLSTVHAQAASSPYDRRIKILGAVLVALVALLLIYLVWYGYSVCVERRQQGKESFATAAVVDETSSSSSDFDDFAEDEETPKRRSPVEEVFVSLDGTEISVVSISGDAPSTELNTTDFRNDVADKFLSDRRSVRKSFSALAQEFVKNMDEELKEIDDEVRSTKSGSMVSGASSLCIYDDTSSCQSRNLFVSGRLTPVGDDDGAWREFIDSPNDEETLPHTSSLNAKPLGSVSPEEYVMPNPTSVVL